MMSLIATGMPHSGPRRLAGGEARIGGARLRQRQLRRDGDEGVQRRLGLLDARQDRARQLDRASARAARRRAAPRRWSGRAVRSWGRGRTMRAARGAAGRSLDDLRDLEEVPVARRALASQASGAGWLVTASSRNGVAIGATWAVGSTPLVSRLSRRREVFQDVVELLGERRFLGGVSGRRASSAMWRTSSRVIAMRGL